MLVVSGKDYVLSFEVRIFVVMSLDELRVDDFVIISCHLAINCKYDLPLIIKCVFQKNQVLVFIYYQYLLFFL